MSNGGFTLGGQTAKQLGMRMLRASQRPILPGTVDRILAIPGRNGAWDFGADLAPRQFNLECAIVKTTPAALQTIISSLAAYLVDQYGKPRTLELVFDLQPERTFYVRYAGNLPIDRIVGLGRFTLPLIAYDPHAYADLDFMDTEEYLYDTDLDYDDGLYYPNSRMVQDFSFVAPGMPVLIGEERRWSGFVWAYPSQYSTMQNYSSLRTPLIVRISGSVTNPTIRNTSTGEEMAINVTLSDEVLLIDSSKFSVKIDDNNALSDMTGDFIGLQPGENQLLFSGAGPSANVTYLWRHKFI